MGGEGIGGGKGSLGRNIAKDEGCGSDSDVPIDYSRICPSASGKFHKLPRTSSDMFSHLSFLRNGGTSTEAAVSVSVFTKIGFMIFALELIHDHIRTGYFIIWFCHSLSINLKEFALRLSMSA